MTTVRPARCLRVLACAVVALWAPAQLAWSEVVWIEVSGASLRYELSGTGAETVVLLHEIGSTLETWDEIMPALRARHSVLRYDLRGFGQSEKIRGDYRMEDAVAELAGLLDSLRPEVPVILVGAAIGGTIALKYAAANPARVRALVLISPIFNAPVSGAMPRGNAAAVAPLRGVDTATLIETQGVRAYLAQQLENIYPQVLRTDPARMARFYGMQLSSDPDSRAKVVRIAGQNGNVANELAAVRAPTLVVATSLFPLRPAAAVKPIADAIAGARFVDVPTGHLAALQSPDLLAPVLLDFMATLPH